jgi:hypothetical protein
VINPLVFNAEMSRTIGDARILNPRVASRLVCRERGPPRGPRCVTGGRYWFGTSSTRRFWARPSRVLLVATKSVLP